MELVAVPTLVVEALGSKGLQAMLGMDHRSGQALLICLFLPCLSRDVIHIQHRCKNLGVALTTGMQHETRVQLVQRNPGADLRTQQGDRGCVSAMVVTDQESRLLTSIHTTCKECSWMCLNNIVTRLRDMQ